MSKDIQISENEDIWVKYTIVEIYFGKNLEDHYEIKRILRTI